jgi:hypothetical protein
MPWLRRVEVGRGLQAATTAASRGADGQLPPLPQDVAGGRASSTASRGAGEGIDQVSPADVEAAFEDSRQSAGLPDAQTLAELERQLDDWLDQGDELDNCEEVTASG